MSRYLPLCNYVSKKTGLPVGLALIFNLTSGAAIGNAGYYLATGEAHAYDMTLLTLFAIGLCFKTEQAIASHLTASRTGLTKGGMILRSAQIGSFFAPFIITAGVHLAQPPEKRAEAPKPEGPAPTMSLEAR